MLVDEPLDLLRLHRPSKFSDFVGQDMAVDQARALLRNGGAAVFHGPSGVGKTAVAKVLAQAFLCDGRKADGSPCGDCPPCRGIHGGTLTGSYVLMNGPDDGRAKPIGEAVAVAGEGRPCVIIIDNADQLSSQTLLMLQHAVDERRTTTLIVLIIRDSEAILAREPWMQWRFSWIAFPPASDSAIREYLRQTASAQGKAISDRALDWCATSAKGSIALALRFLERELTMTVGAPALPEPVTSVAERLVWNFVAGSPVTDVDALLRKYSAEALRREIEDRFGAGLDMIRQDGNLTGPAEALVALCVRAGKQHRITARECAEALVGIWKPTGHVYSNPAFIRALSRTETLLLNCGYGEQRDNCDRPATRIRTASKTRPGRHLNVEQARALVGYCATATRRHGLTVRLEACLVHGDDATPAKRLGAITHGLSMFMASRKAAPPGWFYLNRQRAAVRETILAVLIDRTQVDAAAEWLRLRIGEDGGLRTCRESADDRRLAFQASVLREMLSSLNPGFYVRDIDGQPQYLVDAVGVAPPQRADLGDPFTKRTIGISVAYAEQAPTGNAYDAIRAAFDPMALADWRREQRTDALLEAVAM
jgi:hypothetical protein